MNEAEVRATLRDVRSKYDDAHQEYAELQDEQEELEQDAEQYKEAAAVAHGFFAEKAAEVKEMDPETIKEKFTTEEIREDLLGDVEFHIGSPETEEEEEEETKFEDNPEKSDNLGGGEKDAWYEQEASQAVESITVQHDEI